jgi:hypothetical protein
MEMRQQATDLRNSLRERLDTVKKVTAEGREITWGEDNTYNVSVVRKVNGERSMIVTASHGGDTPLPIVADLIPDGTFVRPGRIPNGTGMVDGLNHAEPKAIRFADQMPDIVGVETIAPTRNPCKGFCRGFIQSRGDQDFASVVPN